jgi:hypothetical protein
VLAGHCEREGGDVDRIRKTILWVEPIEPTAEGGRVFAERMRPYADVGIQEVHVMPPAGDPVAYVQGLSAHVVGRLESVH